MNVYDAAKKRIEWCLSNFDYCYVSFSGGKDSGVLLELTAEMAKASGKRWGIFHIDYEAQYKMTTDYVSKTLSKYRGIADIYHVCVPFKVTTCTSMFQSYWRPWEKSLEYLWVRHMPEGAMTTDDFLFLKPEMWDYDFQEKFGEWICRKFGRVCCFVGIRTGESLNRWRTIHAERENRHNYKGMKWTTVIGDCVAAYPIYDFQLEDIWTAYAKNGWEYNHIYDMLYLAGVPLHKMRVASPFIDSGQESLKLYKAIDPDTWGKMVGRVNGVNFAGLYGGTTVMGWKAITKPAHFTWKQYMYFLLDTLPEETKKNYLRKLETSIKFWREKGGCLSDETIKELKEEGADFEVMGDSNYHTDKKPVRMEYLDDTEVKAFKEIPTYKRMCVCIIKNDHLCKYMGFSLTKNEMERRRAIQQKYANL